MRTVKPVGLSLMRDHFISTLPERPYCGVNGAHQVLRREDALKFPLIQFNHPYFRHWIGVDVDDKYGPLAWEKSGLPPNLIMVNDQNGHCHYLYNLQRPVYTHPERLPTTAARYLSAVTRGLTKAVGGDFRYAGLLVKNPLHRRWRTIETRDKGYSLDELANNVDLKVSKDAELASDSIGRNCALFDGLRKWAYRERARHTGLIGFQVAVMEQALSMNATFAYPLSENEVRSVVKSVTVWTWSRYRGTGGRPNLGIMKLSGPIPLAEKQALAAYRTNRLQIELTKAKIETAMLCLGPKATQREVAAKAEVSVRTVQTYWRELGNKINFIAMSAAA